MQDGEWQWGKQPYDRHNQAPVVSVETTSQPNHYFTYKKPFHIWFVLQRGLPRRTREDARQPPSKWGKDRTEPDAVDLHPEEDVPSVRLPRRGKASAASYFRNWEDTDTSEDECRILEPLNIQPLCSFPPGPEAPLTSATPAARSEPPSAACAKASARGRGRGKRGVIKGQGDPLAKRQKVVASKPKGPRPSFAG